MASSKLIAVDFDEVLFPLFTEYAKYYQKRCAKKVRLPLKYPYHFSTALDISEENSRIMLAEFFDSEDHYNLTPIAGSVSTLNKLKEEGWRLSIVTARTKSTTRPTQYLVDKYFKNIFDDVIYCNYHTTFEVPKYRVCEHMGAKVLIDDNYKNCMECLDIGMGAVNFVGNPVYPWCEESKISARTWDDVYDLLA